MGVTLKVREAGRSEVGRGIARIDPKVFEELGLVSGDAVLIEGKKKAVALAWKGGLEDYGTGIIRLDGILRHNAGISIDDEVEVSKVECSDAKIIELAPTRPIEIGQDFLEYMKDRFMNMPLFQGNSLQLEVMGTTLSFVVTRTSPSGAVRITPRTQLILSKKPAEIAAIGVTYEDIGGLGKEIELIREMVEIPMKHPEVFKRLGISPPKGVLLHGPPGCGKTLLAKAVANETDAYFLSINGPEIMSKYYGESEARLREIFEEAKKNVPAIIFIDEIDAIAPAREEVTGEVEKRVVAQLLALMDGLEARGDVIVIAATNRPDALDPALRRPGRFDREIEIGVPDREGRKEILQIHTRGMPLAEDVDLEEIAEVTYGYSGADLAALCREAAMNALRRVMPEIKKVETKLSKEFLEKIVVTKEDFAKALSKVEPSAMREVMVEIPRVKWEDIGGLEPVKQQLREMVEWPLKHRKLFDEVGVEPPKGVLLYGPPGCGKTLLAKAVATESGANFIAVRGPELLSKWVGESERAVRKIFRRARVVAPAIIFFDEIDALVPMRGLEAGTQVMERVVAQLLAEMDGIAELKDVVVMGSTNRPDLLDPALLRPGRFDKLIYVPFPDEEARRKILEVHLRKMKLAPDVDLEKLANAMKNYTGADIAAVCKEAGLYAIREAISEAKGKVPEAREVRMEHFEKALERIKGSITDQERDKWKRIRELIGERR